FENLPEEKFIIEKIEDGIERALKLAGECDLVIVCVGNNPLVNGREEVDRYDILLPDHQEKLIREVYRANPNTLLILVSSYPYAINWAKENIPAILWTSHGGQEMGNGIGDIILGKYSPAGRLNITWYKSINDIPPITDYDIIRGKRTYMYFDKEPLFPFGHGLTYTEFKYSDLKINADSFNPSEVIDLEFEIENIGERDSDDVPQVYVRCLNSKVKRPKLQLKGFKRVFIPKGEKVKVNITIPVSELFIWDVRKGKYLIERGDYEILVGASSQDIRLRKKIFINGEEIENRNPYEKNIAFNFDDCNGVFFDTKRDFESTYVIFSGDDSWLLFKDLEFTKRARSIRIELSSPSSFKIVLYFSKIDKEFSFEMLDTSEEWREIVFDLEEVEGIQDLYIKGEKGLKISWFKFEGEGGLL
ncbi:MAG: glycoside hydrolase family 3 C-terminal domain-containing protein, partial [Dictyoglomaceae bacterium]|nr:glycoside hydrolase family 3 C-terminal domain-containing protein [Dictyoglomaceae bacterium]